jgi:hypothetical protein
MPTCGTTPASAVRPSTRGQRIPPANEINPNGFPRIWYGAARAAALYALTYWSRNGLPASTATSDEIATTVGTLVAAVLSAGGELTPQQRQLVDATVAELQRRVRFNLRHHDQGAYYMAWNLLKVARLVKTASDHVEPRTVVVT